jgi:hypothetical protein
LRKHFELKATDAQFYSGREMLSRTVRLVSLAAITATQACTVADEPELGRSDQDLEANNGQNLNGQNLNGQNLNGQNLNGESLDGPNARAFTIWTNLDGVQLGGMPVDSTTLSASVFSGAQGSTPLTGNDFAGAEFQAMRGDLTTVTLRISSIVAPEAPSDVWSYFVDYFDDNDSQWYAICHDGVGPLAAIPLNGTWDHRWNVAGGGSHTDDPTKFTFACEQTGGLAKCVRQGYEPWAMHDGILLANHHQACVRMLRADYCGNGASYTTSGRLVNDYDDIGIQQDTNAFIIEAEWTPNGSACMSLHRRYMGTIPCFDSRLVASCGLRDHFQTGTLIMDEIP